MADFPEVFQSAVDRRSPQFQKRRRAMEALVARMFRDEAGIRQGGGAEARRRQHAKGRLTARERIRHLIDPEPPFLELGIYAAHQMYAEWGGARAAGVIVGIAKVCGRHFMVIANDATVKAGSFFPMTAKKVLRPRPSRWRTVCPPSTWWIPPAFFCPCRRTCSPTSMILAGSSTTTPSCPPGRSADHRRHGFLRGRRSLPAVDVRQAADDRGQRALSGRTRPGQGGHRAGGVQRGAGGAGGARQPQRHRRFPEKDDLSCLRRIRELVDKMGRRTHSGLDCRPRSSPAMTRRSLGASFPPIPPASTRCGR